MGDALVLSRQRVGTEHWHESAFVLQWERLGEVHDVLETALLAEAYVLGLVQRLQAEVLIACQAAPATVMILGLSLQLHLDLTRSIGHKLPRDKPNERRGARDE